MRKVPRDRCGRPAATCQRPRRLPQLHRQPRDPERPVTRKWKLPLLEHQVAVTDAAGVNADEYLAATG
jgi:hypothetical protein